MVEKNISAEKVTLLLIPPIINNFDFSSEKNSISFISNVKKIEFTSDKLKLKEINKDEYAKKINKCKEENKKIVLLNCSIDDIEKKFLEDLNLNIEKIILLDLSSNDLVAEIMKDLIICPFCKSIIKKETISNDEFFCKEKKKKISITLVEEFKELITEDYFDNSKKLMEYLLKNYKPSFLKISVKNKEEIIDSENLKDKILKFIKE